MFSSIVYLRNVTSYRRCNEGFQTASLEKGDVADAGDLFDGNGGDEDEDARLALDCKISSISRLQWERMLLFIHRFSRVARPSDNQVHQEVCDAYRILAFTEDHC